MPGTGEGGKSYIPRSGCVWYGLIVVYAMRSENGQPEGITLFYSQDGGENWNRVANVGLPEVFDVPSNSVAAGGDAGMHRAQFWGGPKPFPAGGRLTTLDFLDVD